MAEMADYDWVVEWESIFDACLTVVAGESPAEVLALFGVRNDAPTWPPFENLDEPTVGVVPVPGGTIAVEFYGAEGLRPVVLERLARRGRAASCAGDSMQGSMALSLAADGAVRATFTDLDRIAPTGSDAPTVAEHLHGLHFSVRPSASMLTLMHRFTGIAIPRGIFDAPQVVHRITPLDD